MDWSTLVVTILTSSAISAIVSSLFSEWQKRNDYKRDYYKKIIDKRLEAYEKLNKFICDMANTRRIMNPDLNETYEEGTIIFDCFVEKDSIKKSLEKTIDVLDYGVWYSEEISINLVKMNEILAFAVTTVEHPTVDNLKRYNLNKNIISNSYWHINLGAYLYKEFDNIVKNIKKAIVNDRKTLCEVEDFLK